MKRHRRQAVVGVVVNGSGPRAPRERRRLLRALLWRAERNGLLAESLRYRESLAGSGVSVVVSQGRYPGEEVRADRNWPYSKQVSFLPNRLNDALVNLPADQWTAVADYWHYLYGNVGEVLAIEPHHRFGLSAKLASLTLTGIGQKALAPHLSS